MEYAASTTDNNWLLIKKNNKKNIWAQFNLNNLLEVLNKQRCPYLNRLQIQNLNLLQFCQTDGPASPDPLSGCDWSV